MLFKSTNVMVWGLVAVKFLFYSNLQSHEYNYTPPKLKVKDALPNKPSCAIWMQGASSGMVVFGLHWQLH
jgi:hypothetical protein